MGDEKGVVLEFLLDEVSKVRAECETKTRLMEMTMSEYISSESSQVVER